MSEPDERPLTEEEEKKWNLAKEEFTDEYLDELVRTGMITVININGVDHYTITEKGLKSLEEPDPK